MFDLGFTEMAVILVVALLVFGPHKLPELARNLGKSLAEFRRASTDLRRSIMEAAHRRSRERRRVRPTKSPRRRCRSRPPAPQTSPWLPPRAAG